MVGLCFSGGYTKVNKVIGVVLRMPLVAPIVNKVAMRSSKHQFGQIITTSRRDPTGIMGDKRNHPQIALIQVSGPFLRGEGRPMRRSAALI